MVWICDGAKWIWDWVKENYPESVQILDYYHCKEKLCEFAKEFFKEETPMHEWIDEQEGLLLADQVDWVIANISLMTCNGKAKQSQRAVLTYYENNRERMKYQTYRQKGLLIAAMTRSNALYCTITWNFRHISSRLWHFRDGFRQIQSRLWHFRGGFHRIQSLARLFLYSPGPLLPHLVGPIQEKLN
jgi:hypothetical protein